jgi:predicted hydrocarbon binding protein
VPAIAKSGYHFPNRIARSLLLALEDVTGKNGVSAVLNLAGLSSWVDHFPADDMEQGVDFAEVSAIHTALEEVYGARAGRAFSRRTAAAMLQAWSHVPPLSGMLPAIDNPEDVLPALTALAEAVSHSSDQSCAVSETPDALLFTVTRCPVCWGRASQEPLCSTMVGLLEETTRRLNPGQSLSVEETHCIARGDPACVFCLVKAPAG